jgi:hypothetical protein
MYYYRCHIEGKQFVVIENQSQLGKTLCIEKEKQEAKSCYPFEETSSLLQITQQCQRILLLKNFPVYQQLSATTSNEDTSRKEDRTQTRDVKNQEIAARYGLEFVVEKKIKM